MSTNIDNIIVPFGDSKDVVIDTVRAGTKWAFAGATGMKFPGRAGIAMMASVVADRTVESCF